PQPPTLIALNVDPADAVKNYPADVVIEADATAGAAALTHALEQRPGLEALGARLAELRATVRAELADTDPDALAFLTALERVLPDNATVVCDMCIPGYWIGGFLTIPNPRRLAYPLGWGTLGCGFPQGLGAALAGTGPVVSVSGDGGFLYAPGELAAAVQERIPLTAVIVDDGGYGMLRFDQDLHGDPHEGVDLVTPDFVALAGAFGVHAEAVDGLADDFADALARQLTMDEPTVLVARAALTPPPNVSPRWYRR
ncbi:MAG TPA: thiamine pyrophosphate-dependent enzyme, partial [Thermoleophilaceae bacterium]